ncbi:hypothetical protein AAFF_G00163030 [Aldrovandia affinis]|uniref:Uncharacterized protein n=1 Tax=Aldrovandia affinis TaxID=143900 RepID=A0AAD7WWE3_9TELE|nr:hypothetical protein AAFF_G00163030 [Aldrovandia affinis]
MTESESLIFSLPPVPSLQQPAARPVHSPLTPHPDTPPTDPRGGALGLLLLLQAGGHALTSCSTHHVLSSSSPLPSYATARTRGRLSPRSAETPRFSAVPAPERAGSLIGCGDREAEGGMSMRSRTLYLSPSQLLLPLGFSSSHCDSALASFTESARLAPQQAHRPIILLL